MKFKSLFAFILVLTGCGSPITGALPEFSATPRSVIVDTDMALDDWTAVLYTLQRPDLNVVAITVTGAGEAHCEPGMKHALELIQLVGKSNIPVACGRETPVAGGHEFPVEWRDSVDSLAGLDLPDSAELPDERSAPQLIVDLVSTRPGELTILTLGPLTNLADAFDTNPDLAGQISMIYVMGGAVRTDGNVAEDWLAEWNIYADPRAAQAILDSGDALTFVPLDATNYAPIRLEFYRALRDQRTSPAAEFVFQALTANYDLISAHSLYFWDPLTAAILSDENLATFETMRLRVLQDGALSGQTVEDADGAIVRVATSADGTSFENILLGVLNLE
jgi:inosine-uridine nucleoside N-ribohydrolase